MSRLEAGGRLQRINRGRGGPNSYRLMPAGEITVAEPAEPAEPAAATVVQFPTDRAGLLRLARDVGAALLAA